MSISKWFKRKRNLEPNIMGTPKTDPKDFEVPEGVHSILPPGYSPGAFARDVVALFETPQPARVSIPELARTWESEAIRNGRTPITARALAADWGKFFNRFPKTNLFKHIQAHTGGDPVASAQIFTAIMDTGTKGGIRDPFPGIIARADQGIPFLVPGRGGKRPKDVEGHGMVHASLIARAWHIQPLVDTLNLQYETYSKRSEACTEVPWPDDVDVVSLRSHGVSDITRIIATDLMRPDDEFFPALARRELRQAVYREVQPAPPRKFGMLIDVSGSMGADLKDGEYTRADYAIASAICLLQNALAGGNEVVLRLFDGAPHEPMRGTPEEISRQLLNCPFSGGGTCIDRAVKAIEADGVEESILITDGDDDSKYRPKIPLTVYLTGCSEQSCARLQKYARRVHIVQ